MDPFEKDIRARITEIDAALDTLKGERETLQNLLYMRAARGRAAEVTDKRSYRRIYNEQKIELLLRHQSRGLRLREISRKLLTQNVIIKEPTLRSYLTRMAKKGVLVHDKRTGAWRVKSSED